MEKYEWIEWETLDCVAEQEKGYFTHEEYSKIVRKWKRKYKGSNIRITVHGEYDEDVYGSYPVLEVEKGVVRRNYSYHVYLWNNWKEQQKALAKEKAQKKRLLLLQLEEPVEASHKGIRLLLEEAKHAKDNGADIWKL